MIWHSVFRMWGREKFYVSVAAEMTTVGNGPQSLLYVQVPIELEKILIRSYTSCQSLQNL